MTVVLEHQRPLDGTWVTAARFDVAIDGVTQPQFTLGSIGVGDTLDESERAAVEEWLVIFGLPYCAARTGGPDGIELDEVVLHRSPAGIRGECPTWAEAGAAAQRQVQDALAGQSELLKTTELRLVELKVLVKEDGSTDGECRVDGVPSDSLLAQLTRLEWPKGAYLYKQTWFVVPSDTSGGW